LLTESLRLGPPNARRVPTDAILRPFVLLIIVLLVGPDLFALVELTTLLELLGATLFVLAFAVGFEMLGGAALARLKALFVPLECSMLIEMRGGPVTFAFAFLFVAGRGLVLASLCMVCYMGISLFVQVVI
jgi:hypothetical protein